MSTEDTSANVIQEAGGPHARSSSLVGDPRSFSLGLLGTYLAGTGLVLGVRSANAGLAAVHVVLLAIVVWAAWSRGAWARLAGDWLPLVAAPVLYAEIPALIAALRTTYHDAAIQSIELAIFGVQPAQAFAAALPTTALSEVLHAGYLAYYPAIFVPPVLLWLRGERRGFLETVAALTAVYLVCWVIFVAMPVEGPRYQWGPAAAAPDGPMRRFANAVLAAGSSRGAAFPSSHMAVMVAQAILALRWQRSVGAVVSVVAVLVAFGAVYGGFHYATDMIAGAVLGAVVAGSCLLSFSKASRGAQ